MTARSALSAQAMPAAVQSAKAAGLRVVAVTSTVPADSLKEADVVLERVGELPRVLADLETATEWLE